MVDPDRDSRRREPPKSRPAPQADAGRAPGSDVPAEKDLHLWTIPGLAMPFVWIEALRFWVGRFEVTNAQFRAFRPLHDSGDYKGISLDEETQPVVHVTYSDAIGFSDWLTPFERAAGRLPEGFVYRLPTGDEWTCFAQCGDGRKYPWGNRWPPTRGNYSGQSSAGRFRMAGYDDSFPATCPVEASGENEWGLFGVGGNVWEWTSEERHGCRALRGASWFGMEPEILECGYRFFSQPTFSYNHSGFRLVLAPPVPPAS